MNKRCQPRFKNRNASLTPEVQRAESSLMGFYRLATNAHLKRKRPRPAGLKPGYEKPPMKRHWALYGITEQPETATRPWSTMDGCPTTASRQVFWWYLKRSPGRKAAKLVVVAGRLNEPTTFGAREPIVACFTAGCSHLAPCSPWRAKFTAGLWGGEKCTAGVGFSGQRCDWQPSRHIRRSSAPDLVNGLP